MRALNEEPRGAAVQTDQVLYKLGRRAIEWSLLPWLRERSMLVKCYSLLEDDWLVRLRELRDFEKKHGMTPSQVAISWPLAQDGVISIPKTSNRNRLEKNALALENPLTTSHQQERDALFPTLKGPTPLEMI